MEDKNFKIKDAVKKIICCEMLGYSCSFAYFKLISLASSKNFLEKRIGYFITTSFALNTPESLIIISTIQKDLLDENPNVICCALNAISKMDNPEIVPALSQHVLKTFTHQNLRVRKYCVIAIQRLLQLSPNLKVSDYIRRFIFDSDPMIALSSLNIVYDLLEKNTMEYRDLIDPLFFILKQILEYKLPIDYTYQGIPAPWTIVKILQCLAILCKYNEKAKKGLFFIIQNIFSIAKGKVGIFLLYECIKTMILIKPFREMIDVCFDKIDEFISSEIQNVKYCGVILIGLMIKENIKITKKYKEFCIKNIDLIPIDDLKHIIIEITTFENFDYVKDVIQRMFLDSNNEEMKQITSHIFILLIDKHSKDEKIFQTFLVKFLKNDFILRNIIQPSLNIKPKHKEIVYKLVFPNIRLLDIDILNQLIEMLISDDQIKNFNIQTFFELIEEYLKEYIHYKGFEVIKTLGMLLKICMKHQKVPDSFKKIITKFKESRNVQIQQISIEFETIIKQNFENYGKIEKIDFINDFSFLTNYTSDKSFIVETPIKLKIENSIKPIKTEPYQPNIESPLDDFKDFQLSLKDIKKVWIDEDDEQKLEKMNPEILKNKNETLKETIYISSPKITKNLNSPKTKSSLELIQDKKENTKSKNDEDNIIPIQNLKNSPKKSKISSPKSQTQIPISPDDIFSNDNEIRKKIKIINDLLKNEESKFLFKDSNLQIEYKEQKTFESLTYLFSIYSILSNLSLKFETSYHIEIIGEGFVGNHSNIIHLKNSSQDIAVIVKMKDHFHHQIPIKINFDDDENQSNIKYLNIPLEMSHFLLPKILTINEFSEEWKDQDHEKKVHINNNMTIDQLDLIQFNFYELMKIENELIGISQLVSTKTKLFLHVKNTPIGIVLTIRSDSPLVLEICKWIQKSLMV